MRTAKEPASDAIKQNRGPQLASSPLWIPSPRATSPEPTSPTAGWACGFSCNRGPPNDVLLHIICSILPTSPTGSHRDSGRQSHLLRVPRIANQGIISGRSGTRRRQGANRDRLRGFSRASVRELGSPHLARPLGVRGTCRGCIFPSKGPSVPPTETLYKKAIVLAPEPLATWMQLTRMFTRDCWLRRFRSFGRSRAKQKAAPAGFFCLTADSLTPNERLRRSPTYSSHRCLLVAAATCSFFASESSTI